MSNTKRVIIVKNLLLRLLVRLYFKFLTNPSDLQRTLWIKLDQKMVSLVLLGGNGWMILKQIQNGNYLYLILVNCELFITFFHENRILNFLIKVLNWAVRIFLACRLVHLPMTKASVRAMDVITDFLTSPSSPQEIQDLQSSPRFYEVQTRLHLEVPPS